MPQSRFVLVTGATGNQGGAVVRALLARGHQVRALTRGSASAAAQRLSAQGVEIALGDFADHGSLVRAARGVDTVYAMSSPSEHGVAIETAQGIAVIEAAKAAGVGHLVYSSVAGADRATDIPHFDSKYEVEKHLASSGLHYTIVAPVFFMENLLSPWGPPGLPQGKLAMAMPATRALQQISVEDIGAFAAAVIERRDAVFSRRIDIAGDELCGDEAASVLSRVTGRAFRYEGFSPQVLRAQSEDLAAMYEWLAHTGFAADIACLRREYPEVGWHGYEAWAREQDWSLLDQS